jgi:beta-1,4-N-acetylglucosaminyltransferase
MLLSTFILSVATILITLLILITTRLLSILPPRRERPARRSRSAVAKADNGKGHIMIVLGSGGHTAEMLLLLSTVSLGEFGRRTWVVSDGDAFSAARAVGVENGVKGGEWEVITIPRARRVHQTLLTAPISSVVCLWTCLRLLSRHPPSIILTNGPGTGVIVVLASIILRAFSTGGAPVGTTSTAQMTRIVYVESLARVRKLSLSGRLLRRAVDRFIVQWEWLKGEGEWTGGSFVLDAALQAADEMSEQSAGTAMERERVVI